RASAPSWVQREIRSTPSIASIRRNGPLASSPELVHAHQVRVREPSGDAQLVLERAELRRVEPVEPLLREELTARAIPHERHVAHPPATERADELEISPRHPWPRATTRRARRRPGSAPRRARTGVRGTPR